MGKKKAFDKDLEWLKEKLWNKWQVIRRHPDYLKLCKGLKFNDVGVASDVDVQKMKHAKERFGLALIYDPSEDFSIDTFLDSPFFENIFAVTVEWRTEIERDGSEVRT